MTKTEAEPASNEGEPAEPPCELFAGPETRKVNLKHLLVALWFGGWLPVAILDLLSDPRQRMSFFHDVAVQVRLLVALPLLLAARPVVEKVLARALRDLFQARIVPPEAQLRISTALRRRARFTERPLVLTLFLLLAGTMAASEFAVARKMMHVLSWRSEGDELSNAGLWYFCITNPIYRLVVVRWLWGLGMWFISMVQLAGALRPDPLHPDRQGGLERLTTAHAVFGLVLLGGSSSVAGALANQVIYEGATFETIKPLMITTCVFLLSFVLGALLPLVVPLMLARRRALVEYGRVATEQERAFAAYWFTKRSKTSEELLKSQDFSALTDLLSSYAVALDMKVFPIQRPVLIPLLLAVGLPMLPVIALRLPIVELLKQLAALM
jgi:hypothetical protein